MLKHTFSLLCSQLNWFMFLARKKKTQSWTVQTLKILTRVYLNDCKQEEVNQVELSGFLPNPIELKTTLTSIDWLCSPSLSTSFFTFFFFFFFSFGDSSSSSLISLTRGSGDVSRIYNSQGLLTYRQ